MALSHSPKIVTDGLVLCLDAADPKSYSGSGTTWTDRSGNGNNGTLTNDPTFDSAIGGSLVFDGSDARVECGSDSSIDIDPTGTMTLAAWVNANSIASNGHVIGKQQYGNGYILHYDAAYESVSGGGFQTTNVGNNQFEWGQNIEAGKWYY